MTGTTNETNTKYSGRIVQWDEIRDYGFIESPEVLPFGSTRIFAHQSNANCILSLGVYVTFEVGKPYKLNQSPQAVRVNVVEDVIAPINDAVVEIGVKAVN